jgi:DNA polymerase III epsilon subunit-like protein
MTTNFISLDLEFNQPSRKIIQIGVSIGNQTISEKDWIIKKWYVDPEESISPDIVALTGITESDISAHSSSIDDVAKELSGLITKYNCFVNPVTWGGGDSEMLLKLFESNNVKFPHFGRRHIDVKTIHTFINFAKNKNKSGGLASVMGQYKLQFIGKAHRADVDAYNTLRLYFALLNRQTAIEESISKIKTLS